MKKQEPIIGYRLWYFYDEKLHSAWMYNVAWSPGEAIKSDVDAYCRGIHAWKSLPDALSYGNYCDSTKWKPLRKLFTLNKTFINVYGEVYLWGKIAEHEKGYRVEFAYPKKLYVFDSVDDYENIVQFLRRTYGCDVEIAKDIRPLIRELSYKRTGKQRYKIQVKIKDKQPFRSFIRAFPKINCIRGIIHIMATLCFICSYSLVPYFVKNLTLWFSFFTISSIIVIVLMHPYFDRFEKFNKPLL